MKREIDVEVLEFQRYRARELYAEAIWLERHGETRRAIERYLKSAEMDGTSTQGYVAAGLLFDQHEDGESAKECFQWAIDRGNEPMAYYCLAFVQEKEGDLDAALENYQISVNLIPDFTEGHVGMGDIFLRKAEYKKAQQSYERAVYSDPLNLLVHVKRNAVRRYMEFKNPFPGCLPPDPKVQVYAERGAINLGIDYDDGMNIPRYFFHNFSYRSLSVVMKRFLSFSEACSWDFTKVLCSNEISMPLAMAISEILDIPVSNGSDLFPKDHVLFVHGIGAEPGMVNRLLALLYKRNIQFLTLFFAVEPGVFFNLEPNIIGIYARTSLPWYRIEEFSRYQVIPMGGNEVNISLDEEFIDEREPALIADELLNEYCEVDQDMNYKQQVEWYLTEHTDLNFDLS
jgi:hypothetical protein